MQGRQPYTAIKPYFFYVFKITLGRAGHSTTAAHLWDDSSKFSQGLFLDLFYRVESKCMTLLFEGILDSIWTKMWDPFRVLPVYKRPF